MEDNAQPSFDPRILPEAMWEYISQYLNHRERCALRATSRYLNEAMSYSVCNRNMNFLLSQNDGFQVRIVDQAVLEGVQIPYRSVAIYLNEEERDEADSAADETVAELICSRLLTIPHWNIEHVKISGELNCHMATLFRLNTDIVKHLRTLEVLCSNAATVTSSPSDKLVLHTGNLRSFQWVWNYMTYFKQFIHVLAPQVETISILKNFSASYTGSIDIGPCAHVTAIDVDLSCISRRQLECNDYPKAKSLTLRHDADSEYIAVFDWKRVFQNFTALARLSLVSVESEVLATAIDSCHTMTSLEMHDLLLEHGRERILTIPQLRRLQINRCSVIYYYHLVLPMLAELSVYYSARGNLIVNAPELRKFTHCISSNLADVELLGATRLREILLQYYRCDFVPSLYDRDNVSVRKLTIHIRHSSPDIPMILRSVPKLTTLYLSSFGVTSLTETVLEEIPRLFADLETLVIKMYQRHLVCYSVVEKLCKCPKLKYLMLENFALVLTAARLRCIPDRLRNVMFKKVSFTDDARWLRTPLYGRHFVIKNDCVTMDAGQPPPEVLELFTLDDWKIHRCL